MRTKLVCNRYFPDPPGIGGLPPNLLHIPSSLFPKKPSPFHMGLYFFRSACCRIPQSRLRRASSLWQGSLAGSARSQFRTPGCPRRQFRRRVAADNAHGSFLLLVTSLTRPVSAACRRAYYIFPLHYSLNLPGIVTEQNGERKHGHCARTDSGGPPPNFSHITNLLVNNMPCPKKRR